MPQTQKRIRKNIFDSWELLWAQWVYEGAVCPCLWASKCLLLFAELPVNISLERRGDGLLVQQPGPQALLFLIITAIVPILVPWGFQLVPHNPPNPLLKQGFTMEFCLSLEL